MYNPKSKIAEEFICNEEILETIKYAQENKNNLTLIDEILTKAKKASRDMIILTEEQKRNALHSMADALIRNTDKILKKNLLSFLVRDFFIFQEDV